MVANHAHSSLDLSALNSDVEYPLPLDNAAKRCLIHVKLTESCSRTIDNLISSNKGAVFSLWFTVNGGHLTLPSSNGSHTFQFSTAVPNKREQNSTLECFHQSTGQDQQQRLSMIGKLDHKLTVKATDEVYEETKKKAKQLEEKRQGVRAKEIKIPKVGKPKQLGSGSRVTSSGKSSFDVSVLGRSTFSSSNRGGGGASSKPLPSAGRQQKSLKERVVHLLALRPCSGSDVLAKLKKATKKSESFFNNLESVLTEVANLQDTTYHLKDHFYSELDVDNWPFYSEGERDFVKRNLLRMSSLASDSALPILGSMPSMKRSGDESVVNDHVPSKRPKAPKEQLSNISKNSFVQPTAVSSSSSPNITRHSKLSTEPSTNEQRSHSRLSDTKATTTTTTTTTTGSTTTGNSDRSALAAKFVSKRNIIEGSSQPIKKVVDDDVNQKKDMTSISGQYQPPQSEPVVDSSGEVMLMDGVEEKDKKPKKKKKKKKLRSEEVQKAVGGSSDVLFVERDPNKALRRSPDMAIMPTPDVDQMATTTASTDRDHSEAASQFSYNGNAVKPPHSIAAPTDFETLYPMISSSQERLNYKKIFNDEYEDYLLLKEKMDSIQNEVALLSNQLNSLPHNSQEFRELKRKIKKKYVEMQQDTTYQEEKKRLFDLHCKLEHIKRMVVLYDKQQQHSL